MVGEGTIIQRTMDQVPESLLSPVKHFVFLIMIFGLSGAGLVGCAAVLVGGGAAGGFYLGKDKRTMVQISQDSSITTKINAKFLQEETIKVMNINVSTYLGKVTLVGDVASRDVANRAFDLAKATSGVKDVVSQIVIIQ